MGQFAFRWAVTTVAVLIATWAVPGVTASSSASLLGASLLLGILNALVRPILLLLSLPFILVTLGLFIFVLNALLLSLVASVIPGFAVEGFWDALLASIVISLASYAMSCFFRSSDGSWRLITWHGRESSRMKRADARVIE